MRFVLGDCDSESRLVVRALMMDSKFIDPYYLNTVPNVRQ